MTELAIIGAGAAGLASAICLAARGHDVTVFEAASTAGGKIGVTVHDGVEFDTGPSLLTLPEIIDEVFELAGTSLDEQLDLVRHGLAFRYLWPDGAALDVHFGADDTRRSIQKSLGSRAARQFDDFLDYARRIWEAAAPNFVLGPAPSVGSMFKLGLGSLGEVMAIDPLNTMAAGIEKRVEHARLRDILLRYATYNGSNPFEAPATLNCIAWVELGLGGWGVRGGMYELVRAMERVARGLGVEFRLDTPVTSLDLRGGRIGGVTTAAEPKARQSFDAAVVNADLAHLVDDLLPDKLDHRLEAPTTPSMSGWTAVIRARRRPAGVRPPHTVLFPEDYAAEFGDIFERGRPPRQPAIYLCAQEKAHGRAGWDDHEPLFVMVNAPAEPEDGPRPAAVWANLREAVIDRLEKMDLIDADDAVVWERTPADLARQFRGTRGSIYGAASNSRFAAFQRAPNRVGAIDGLYLASGSVHPGGGVPLCVQSGKTAARAAHQDLGD